MPRIYVETDMVTDPETEEPVFFSRRDVTNMTEEEANEVIADTKELAADYPDCKVYKHHCPHVDRVNQPCRWEEI